MRAIRSNKPLIILLSLGLLALTATGLLVMRQSLQPLEARQNPTIVDHSPGDEAPVSRATTLEIAFDQKMDRPSVEAALSVEPAFPYDLAWQSEGKGDRLVIQPRRALDWETTYLVTLETGAHNVAGRPLAEPLSLRFTTGSEVRVVEVLPKQGAAAVDPAQPITIRFDRGVLDAQALNEQVALPQPVLVDPPVPGMGQWLAPDLYGFYPAGGLTAGTEYTVRVNPLVAPAMELPDAFEWHFVTEGPRLNASYPFDGASEVERAAAINLIFNQPMDRESVEQNFQLSVEGERVPTAGAFVWQDDQTLVFEPAEPLALASEYQIEVGTGAKAQGGTRGLASPYRAVFTTVDFLTVESVQPAPGSAEVSIVPTDTVVSIQFNHPVVSLVGLADKAGLTSPIRLSPAVSGEGEWLTTSLFVFRPAEPLDPSTEYVVTVEPNLQDTLGSFLNQPYSWSFVTEFPRVVRVEPSNARRLVPAAGPIGLRFNQAMDEGSSARAFTLRDPGGEPVAGRIEWADDGTLLQFFPDEPLQREVEYTLVLDAGARGARGGTTDEPFEAEVVVAPLPRVVRTSPQEGATEANLFDGIQFTFNTPIETRDLLEHVTIVPTATTVYTYYDPEIFALYLSTAGPLEPSADYTVTLDGALTDESGQPLGEPYTLRFTTAPLPPLLDLLRPSAAGLVGTYNPYTPTLQLVQHRNLSAMTWSLYRVSEDDLLSFLRPDAYERWDSFTGDPSALVTSWDVEVDTSPNIAYFYKTLVPPEGELDSGIYLLRVTAPERNTFTNEPLESKQLMVFTPVNLTLKRAPDEVLVWATDLQSGGPVADLDIDLVSSEGAVFGSGRTDAAGLFRYELSPSDDLGDPYAPVFALSRDGAGTLNGLVSIDWNNGINPFQWQITETTVPQTLYGTIYTDRPIYRPGQTIFFRGVLRQRDGSTLVLPTLETMSLSILYQGEEIDARPITLSPFGTFHGEFTLDEEAETGYYEMRLDQQEIGACYGDGYCAWESVWSAFQVAEYQRPDFEVLVETEPDAVVQGDPINAAVQARYFFGGTLADAPYTWRLTRRPFFFDTNALSGFWSWRDVDDLRDTDTETEVLREGRGTLDDEGQDTVAVRSTLATGEAAPGSQVYVFEAEVRDVNDAILAGRDETVVHAGEFYVGLNLDDYLGNAGRPFTLNVATADPSGALVGDKEVAVEFYQREWYSVREEDEAGRLVWTSAFSDTLVASRPAVTGEDGRTSVTFTPEQGGLYTALARAEDERGNEIRSRTFFWVTDEQFVPWGRDNDDRIELVADKDSYEVGDVARILVPTPFEGMQALVAQEQLSIQDVAVQTLEGTAEVLEIPITEAMIPNVVVSVVAVTGMSEQTPLPEFRVGYVELAVVPREKQLTVELTPLGELANAPAAEPGDEARYRIRVTDADGEPVEAELSLAVVDKAILSLSDVSQTSLVDAFYAARPLAVRTATSLIANVDRLSAQLSPEAKGGGGAGAGEFGPEFLRSNFVDTAYWRADIVTDERGEAEVRFTLPDNLTTWVLTAQAITDERTLVGREETELLTTRPLLVRPTLPRFLVIGDEAELRIVANNNTDHPLEAEITFEVTGLTVRGEVDTTRTATIPAGGSEVLDVPVVVPDDAPDVATITVGASGEGLVDRVQRTIPLFHLTAPEVVASGGVVREGEGAAVESIRLPDDTDPTSGELTVELAPSLAGATESALDWLRDYEFPSTEAVVSVLLPNVATARALDVLNFDRPDLETVLDEEIESGVQKLLLWQNSDGGWGWWRGDESQTWLTAYTLLGLHEAQGADYTVPEERLARATRYLDRWLSRTAELQDDATLDTRAFVLYVLSEAGAGDVSRAAALFDRHALLNTDGKAFLLMALDNAGDGQRPQVQTLASELTANALLSATGAHWEDEQRDPWALDSSLRTTALALRALVRVQPEHMLLPQTVRWLMHARESGHWQTTQATAWSVLALTDYMLASGELEADFAYEVALNDEVVLSGQATEENLADPVALRLALADLLLDEDNRLIITRVPPAEGQRDSGRLYYSLWLRYYLPVETLRARFEGISVSRGYEAVNPATLRSTGVPVDRVGVGDVVQVRLVVNAPNDLYFFTLEDPIPAGFEVIDPALLTSSVAAEGPTQTRVDEPRSTFWYDGWSQSVIRDEKVALFSDLLPRGTYEYTYLLRATVPGEFNVMPAVAYETYQPEVFGRSEGSQFTVER